MTLDLTKPVQTRDGLKARIICTDRKGNGPLVALITTSENEETLFAYNKDGSYFYSADPLFKHSLVNIPEKRWINLCKAGPGVRYYESRRVAEGWGKDQPEYIKTIEVEI